MIMQFHLPTNSKLYKTCEFLKKLNTDYLYTQNYVKLITHELLDISFFSKNGPTPPPK